jgi:uncharacterized protein YidB (DUF937 family)
MGLLDQILGGVLGHGQQQQQPPPPQQAHSMLESILGMLHSPQVGGLGGLLALFQSKGLGHLASSWIAKGPNPPISPNQLQQALGEDQVQQFAQQHGLSQQDAATTLAQMLPHVVDHMSPDGIVPQQTPDMGSMLSMLKSKLLA